MPSEPLSMCSVCGRPECQRDRRAWDEDIYDCEHAARLTAESRLAEALEALRATSCANRTREVGNPEDECNDERGYCARCRVLVGTPPGPAPAACLLPADKEASRLGDAFVRENSKGTRRPIVSRDAVLEEVKRAIEAIGGRFAFDGHAETALEAVRLLKTKEPA
jgi:hypothetical protein